MSLEIDKTTVLLTVDGKFKVKYTFIPKLSRGKIGLGVIGGDALFDEMRVLGVEDFPVISKASLATTWVHLKYE